MDTVSLTGLVSLFCTDPTVAETIGWRIKFWKITVRQNSVRNLLYGQIARGEGKYL